MEVTSTLHYKDERAVWLKPIIKLWSAENVDYSSSHTDKSVFAKTERFKIKKF